VTLFNHCCFPCGQCWDLNGWCWQFKIGGVVSPYQNPEGPPVCPYCPQYNGTWLFVPDAPILPGTTLCQYHVCRPALCCAFDVGASSNYDDWAWRFTLGYASGQAIDTLQPTTPGWRINVDAYGGGSNPDYDGGACPDIFYFHAGSLSQTQPNVFTLVGTPAICVGWPATISLTAVPPPGYAINGVYPPCETCCACPNPPIAYKFTLPDAPQDCSDGPYGQTNAACLCSAVLGKTFELPYIPSAGDPTYRCAYFATFGKWTFALFITNTFPYSRHVQLTAAVDSSCNVPGEISSGTVFEWEQDYSATNLADTPCIAYDLSIVGDDFGCYCLESFLHEGPTITVSPVLAT
jgi:hypothetical protein